MLLMAALQMLTGANKPRVKGTNLTRREFFAAIGAVAVTTVVAKLELVLPTEDTWRFGFWRSVDPTKPALYYGLDTENPMDLRIWFADPTSKELLEQITLEDAKKFAGYEEGVAEINIAQGHAGLMATGGVKMLPGDDWGGMTDLDDKSDAGDGDYPGDPTNGWGSERVTMLTGHDEASIERAVQEATKPEPGPKDT